MRVIKINTTAYVDENFYLVTTLDDDQIQRVIQPIVKLERDGEEFYDNQSLVDALKKEYPRAHVDMYQEFDELTF